MSRELSGRPVALLIAVVFGTGVFCLGAIGDWLALQKSSSPLMVMAGDMVVGLFTGVLVFVYERRRTVVLQRKLEAIRETNHHIRNQLDLIQYSAYQTDDPELFSRLNEAVARIDWTLREILEKQ